MHIWCAISGHGYGHAAQVVPILHKLEQLIPSLHVTLRTTVPISFFQNRLHTQWTYSHSSQDIGCIQDGPLYIDVEKTWNAYAQFHDNWESLVQAECQALTTASPEILLSDISYLAIEAGHRNHIPTVALASLTWDKVLQNLSTPTHPQHKTILHEIRTAYHKADMILQPYPALLFEEHPQVYHIGPILEERPSPTQKLRKRLGTSSEEQIVLIGFGGVPLKTVPFQMLDNLTDYRFIMCGPIPKGLTRVISSMDIPLPFSTILASSDIVMTKPGYSTFIDCVALSKPVVYVRRYNFADEEGLVHYLHQYGQGIELPVEDFLSGEWKLALQSVQHLPMSQNPLPPQLGAQEAAELIAGFTGTNEKTGPSD